MRHIVEDTGNTKPTISSVFFYLQANLNYPENVHSLVLILRHIIRYNMDVNFIKEELLYFDVRKPTSKSEELILRYP